VPTRKSTKRGSSGNAVRAINNRRHRQHPHKVRPVREGGNPLPGRKCLVSRPTCSVCGARKPDAIPVTDVHRATAPGLAPWLNNVCKECWGGITKRTERRKAAA
jgi:hypothetical protein